MRVLTPGGRRDVGAHATPMGLRWIHHPPHGRARVGWPSCIALLLSFGLVSSSACRRAALPAALTDHEFWTLIETLSEPAGAFEVSDTFVSNETRFPDMVRWLRPVGGAYIGVGPEQNFTYIAALRPQMAFIIDIRRENLCLHLLYKALFELSTDRADFVARLFSRPRPAGIGSDESVDHIFGQYDTVQASHDQYEKTLGLVREHLVTTHGLPLSETDLAWIERAFEAFYSAGPQIHFWGSRPGDEAGPSYRQLMAAEDLIRQPRSFLATEERFAFVRELHSRNLIVPVVGDFGGPAAVRRAGAYVGEHGALIQAFYASNVGAYLTKDQARAFCTNLATLPAAPRAWFIESNRMRSLGSKLRACRRDAE